MLPGAEKEMQHFIQGSWTNLAKLGTPAASDGAPIQVSASGLPKRIEKEAKKLVSPKWQLYNSKTNFALQLYLREAVTATFTDVPYRISAICDFWDGRRG